MRSPTRTAAWTLALILCQCLAEGAASAAGLQDRIVLQTEQIDSLHWEVTVSLENHELLAAMTLPFRWGHGRCPIRADSADYRGLRTEYFALKTFFPDSLDHTVLIGLISDLGSGLPPLEPGDGPVARIYFTARTLPKRPLSLDTTFIAPHNTLQIVTPDVRAITPAFESGRTGTATIPRN